MTRGQIVQAFDRIRVWQQGDKRAPHNPLQVLLAPAATCAVNKPAS